MLKQGELIFSSLLPATPLCEDTAVVIRCRVNTVNSIELKNAKNEWCY